jgi:hypothetical protein
VRAIVLVFLFILMIFSGVLMVAGSMFRMW